MLILWIFSYFIFMDKNQEFSPVVLPVFSAGSRLSVSDSLRPDRYLWRTPFLLAFIDGTQRGGHAVRRHQAVDAEEKNIKGDHL